MKEIIGFLLIIIILIIITILFPILWWLYLVCGAIGIIGWCFNKYI